MTAPPELPFGAALAAAYLDSPPLPVTPPLSPTLPGDREATAPRPRVDAPEPSDDAKPRARRADPRADPVDPLDPSSRHVAQLMPPPPSAAPRLADEVVARARGSLELLLPELVRRVAWSGDGKRGSIRLELGGGPLAGAVLEVHADGGRVRVALDTPPGTDRERWREKLELALTRRGVSVADLRVT